VTGTFGLAVFHRDEPDRIVLARRGSPLVIGVGKGEMLAASDVSAILRHTDQVIYLDDNEIAAIRKNDFRIMSLSDEVVERAPETVEWQAEDTEKSGFPHFMLKEIFEQPDTVLAIRGRILPEEALRYGLEAVLPDLKRMKQLILISCGPPTTPGCWAATSSRNDRRHRDVEIASDSARNIHLPGTVVL
jgi:glucosamine--fructose-6-phosphate aminotransferase (isomerizing)